MLSLLIIGALLLNLLALLCFAWVGWSGWMRLRTEPMNSWKD